MIFVLFVFILIILLAVCSKNFIYGGSNIEYPYHELEIKTVDNFNKKDNLFKGAIESFMEVGCKQ